jgi:TrmH family RNA methyltransferase
MFPALSIAQQKKYASLRQKKYREKESLFLAEGLKLTLEAVNSHWPIEAILVERRLLNDSPSAALPADKILACSKEQIQKISVQDTPEGYITVLATPANQKLQKWEHLKKTLSQEQLSMPAFVIHKMQDPGNLGAILRTAAWLGWGGVFCDAETVDCFNPKTVRSSMGSLFRMPVYYIEDIEVLLQQERNRILAACLNGDWEPVRWGKRNWILLGNESRGIPERWLTENNLEQVTIPGNKTLDSLNVTVAASIIAWEVFQLPLKKLQKL